MKDCKVHLIVVSSTYMDVQDADQLKDRLGNIHVTKFSTPKTLNVTKYPKEPNTYIIAFKGIDLIDMDVDNVAMNVASLFLGQLKDYNIHCDMGTTYVDDISGDTDEVKATLKLHNAMSTECYLVGNGSSMFEYKTSDMITQLYDLYKKEIISEAMTEASEEVMNKPANPKNSYSEIMTPVVQPYGDYMSDFLDSNEREEGYKKKKKGKKKKKQINPYGVAKAIRAAKSPKKYYKRHGLIICSKKDAIKKDRRIIKEFLEDFIPGNARWKKDLRKDLLDRWMLSYTITKKQLRHLEKERSETINRTRNSENIQKTLDFTRKLFSVPVDKWNDPTR